MNQGQKRKAGHRRLALVAYGALLVALFVVIAIAEDIGDPGIPSGAVAVVEGVPGEIGTVSKEEFDRAMLQAAIQAGLKEAPRPSDGQFEEMKEAALGELLDAIWIQGEAEEMGIEVGPKQIVSELEQIKEQNFKTDGAFEKFLARSKLTPEDIDKRVRLQILSPQIQQQLTDRAAAPSEGEIEDYYDAAGSTQFTQPASRSIRAIVNQDPKKVEEAKAALESDDSAKNWVVVARRFSEDTSTKNAGGLQVGVTAESGRFPENVETAMFAAPLLQVEGPIKTPDGSYVFQVEEATAEEVRALDDVKAQIITQLTQQAQQVSFSEFASSYQNKWISRSFCAEGVVIEQCANYVSVGRPANAPPACYEADPKGGRPRDCPAPVLQTAPALPGSVSILAPQGKRLPQRPRPQGLEDRGEVSWRLVPAWPV